ncbi:metallo-beta-lactamase family protein [Pseudomonas flavescens]|uniref:Metallo-beta-lactamase family protein n=1 Tax=Phytopseudomonas flavescens TaxID=29435 RepID=A0A1G8L7W5_9GAMM|nr:metallo-beta-lactamase family protein [Pseudomonas flavescens]
MPISSVGAGRARENSEAAPNDPSEIDWPRLPIMRDSPLATRFTQAYRELKDFWNDEAVARVQSGRRPLAFEQLITIDRHADHQKILSHLVSARPAIVIVGHGMCSSGRIVN